MQQDIAAKEGRVILEERQHVHMDETRRLHCVEDVWMDTVGICEELDVCQAMIAMLECGCGR